MADSENTTKQSARYVVITPVRDEEEHLAATIQSMMQQTVLPQEWVIVDDGSQDGTGKILDDYASRFPWIRAIHRQDRGFRKAGGGVVDAFNDGYRALDSSAWEFVVKFDGDLTFEPDYFARCLAEFERDPKLGVGGGVICYVENGVKACWEGIGGLLAAPGWDTMDEVKANSLGWSSRSFPLLHLVHHRHTGAADGLWPTLVKYGRANYICGYHPLFMLTKCMVRLIRKPYVIGSMGLIYGFVSGYVNHVPQFNDPDAIAYLRQQQLRRLWGGETIWR